MEKRFWFTVLFPLLSFYAISQGVNKNLNMISVTDTDNRITKLDLPDKKAFVIIILGPDCPVSQKYIPAINTLGKSFEHDIDIIGVFPSYFTVNEVAAFQSEYELKFPCFIDHNMKVIDQLEAKVTPEVFLFAPGFKPWYSGAIDNWFYELGKYRTEITQHYLKDAIESLYDGKKNHIAKTEAIGCLIQQNKKSGASSHHLHH